MRCHYPGRPATPPRVHPETIASRPRAHLESVVPTRTLPVRGSPWSEGPRLAGGLRRSYGSSRDPGGEVSQFPLSSRVPSPYYMRVAAKRLEAESIEELAELWDCALDEGDEVDFRHADGSLLDQDEFGRLPHGGGSVSPVPLSALAVPSGASANSRRVRAKSGRAGDRRTVHAWLDPVGASGARNPGCR